MKNIFIVSLLLLVTHIDTFAQSSWEYLLAYGNSELVCEGNSAYYFASESGIFTFQKDDNSIEVYSKQNILSASEVSQIEYNTTNQLLVIGFSNGNIDLISEENEVYTITDVARKSIIGDKTLYGITCYEEYAYMAYGFGIVVLDTERREIKDTYIIGDGGSYLSVYDVSIFNETIYAATESGLLCADLNDPNLLDYSHWKHPEDEKIINGKYKMVRSDSEHLFAIYTEDEWYTERCFHTTDGENWEEVLQTVPIFDDLYVSQTLDYFVYRSHKSVVLFNKEFQKQGSINSYTINGENIDNISPRSVILSNDGRIVIADNIYGGITYANSQFNQIQPDGPISNNSYDIDIEQSVVRVASGDRGEGYWGNYSEGEIKEYTSANGWSAYNYDTDPMLDEDSLRQIVTIETDITDPNHFFASSHGRGIMEFKDGVAINRFHEGNSSLQDALGGSDYTFIVGLVLDSENNLWATNSLASDVLSKFTQSSAGKWESESFTLPELSNDYHMGEIIIADDNNLWMIVDGTGSYSGLYVVDNTVSSKKRVKAQSYFSNGTDETITSLGQVNAIDKDLNGEIWIGTEKGVAVFYQPENVFNTTTLYASQPSEDNDDNYYNPLLSTQNVLSMYIDPANRKWFGTENSGLFLYSEDGTQLIDHFTTENSPLISNTILSLDMDEASGELYIATTKGLVKYKTGSTASNDYFSDVYAYPNPVRETYHGDVYIRGLMQDTNVKITDISGRLVYETTSLGGQAVWNGCDLNGNRVYTGVYMVFCASDNGEESAVTKILFIH